jgi:hypothetical protein
MNEFKPIIKCNEEWITKYLKDVLSRLPKIFAPHSIEKLEHNLWEYYLLGLISAETRNYYYNILDNNLKTVLEIATEKEIEEIKKEEVKDDE